MKKIILIALFLSGCSSTNTCHLLSVAYNEQDELSPIWYKETAKVLRECDYIIQEDSERGKE